MLLNSIRAQQQYAQAKAIGQLHSNQQIGSYQGRDPQTGNRIFAMADGSISKARYLSSKDPLTSKILYTPSQIAPIPGQCV